MAKLNEAQKHEIFKNAVNLYTKIGELRNANRKVLETYRKKQHEITRAASKSSKAISVFGIPVFFLQYIKVLPELSNLANSMKDYLFDLTKTQYILNFIQSELPKPWEVYEEKERLENDPSYLAYFRVYRYILEILGSIEADIQKYPDLYNIKKKIEPKAIEVAKAEWEKVKREALAKAGMGALPVIAVAIIIALVFALETISKAITGSGVLENIIGKITNSAKEKIKALAEYEIYRAKERKKLEETLRKEGKTEKEIKAKSETIAKGETGLGFTNVLTYGLLALLGITAIQFLRR